jgi:hypothetical protein
VKTIKVGPELDLNLKLAEKPDPKQFKGNFFGQ